MKHLCANNSSLFGARDPDTDRVDPELSPVIRNYILIVYCGHLLMRSDVFMEGNVKSILLRLDFLFYFYRPIVV